MSVNFPGTLCSFKRPYASIDRNRAEVDCSVLKNQAAMQPVKILLGRLYQTAPAAPSLRFIPFLGTLRTTLYSSLYPTLD